MPLFGSKFSPKKTPIRKSAPNLNNRDALEDLVLDHRIVKLRLGDQKLKFENGEWLPESGQSSSTYKTNVKMKKQIQDLQEENNLLRIKYEIILNMLTQTTAESHLQERELVKLKKLSKK